MIQICERLVKWVERIVSVINNISCREGLAFFQSRGKENNRPFWFYGNVCCGVGNGKYVCDIPWRAIVDLVSFQFLTETEMFPMRRIGDIFMANLQIGAWEQADCIAKGRIAQGCIVFEIGFCIECDRMEIAGEAAFFV